MANSYKERVGYQVLTHEELDNNFRYGYFWHNNFQYKKGMTTIAFPSMVGDEPPTFSSTDILKNYVCHTDGCPVGRDPVSDILNYAGTYWKELNGGIPPASQLLDIKQKDFLISSTITAPYTFSLSPDNAYSIISFEINGDDRTKITGTNPNGDWTTIHNLGNPADVIIGVQWNPTTTYTELQSGDVVVIKYLTTGANSLILANPPYPIYTDSTLTGDGSSLNPLSTSTYVEVDISSIDIQNIGSIPFQCLPAPTNGNYYMFEKIIVEYTYDSIIYTSTALNLIFNDYITSSIPISMLSSAYSSKLIIGNNVNALQFFNIPFALYLTTDDFSDPQFGDGTIKLKIWYNEITFG